MKNPVNAENHARKIADHVLRAVERFFTIEAASGIALLLATCAALLWSNSPWSGGYEYFWNQSFTSPYGIAFSLRQFVNDGLMSLFFFVIGLEIRRELYEGELANARRALLPLFAAAGGMAIPAAIFFLVSRSQPAIRSGWGVPTATDIAFAIGAISILGSRVGRPLRVVLLTLAVVDDIGAILLIALFYAHDIAPLGLLIGGAGVLAALPFRRSRRANPFVYLLPGAIIWFGLHRAHIHPTVSGVILGLLVPIGREEQSPAKKLQALLHPWVSYAIMPLFAFANAGINLSINFNATDSWPLLLGVYLGLVLGKPIGICLGSFAAVKLRVSSLPEGVSWRGIVVIGCMAGIGFTMAIFIAGLAFTNQPQLALAKLAILAASATAATTGVVLGRVVLLSPDAKT